jgi:hypothetical protein
VTETPFLPASPVLLAGRHIKRQIRKQRLRRGEGNYFIPTPRARGIESRFWAPPGGDKGRRRRWWWWRHSCSRRPTSAIASFGFDNKSLTVRCVGDIRQLKRCCTCWMSPHAQFGEPIFPILCWCWPKFVVLNSPFLQARQPVIWGLRPILLGLNVVDRESFEIIITKLNYYVQR